MATGKYKQWQTPECLALLEGWARDGLTDAQIAHNIGIKRQTLYDWKKHYPDISDTLKKGKEVVDRQVENALLKRAMGMVAKTTTYKMVKVDPDILKVRRVRFLNKYKLDHPEMTKKELTMVAIEHVPTYERIPIVQNENELAPDVSAAIFWLKNRKPETYRDKSFKDLNEAQANKARADADRSKAEARISEYKAKELEGKGETNPIILALSKAMQERQDKQGDEPKNEDTAENS